MLHHDLRRAEHVPGRRQPQPDLADLDGLARRERAELAAGPVAQPDPHDREGFGGGDDDPVPAARVIAVPVADDGEGNGADRVDEKGAGLDEEPLGPDLEPGFGTCAHEEASSARAPTLEGSTLPFLHRGRL